MSVETGLYIYLFGSSVTQITKWLFLFFILILTTLMH